MITTYPGGKNPHYHKLINQIPPHNTYIETHLGSGAVLRRKRPAQLNIGIDINPAVIEAHSGGNADGLDTLDDIGENAVAEEASVEMPCIESEYRYLCADAVVFLETWQFTGREFVYADPPYLRHTRSSPRPLYEFEYTDADHVRLLTCLKSLDCPVMISGYWSEMYGDMLAGWRSFSFQARTRGGGTATEWIWMNYPEPVELHDYRFLGDSFRKRQDIKRQKERWINRLVKMNRLQRQAMLWAIQEAGMFPAAALGENADISPGSEVL